MKKYIPYTLSKHLKIYSYFQLEEDTENYIQYQIMAIQEKKTVTLRLKKGVLPHIFHCQKKTVPKPERKSGVKRRRMELVQEIISQVSSITGLFQT